MMLFWQKRLLIANKRRSMNAKTGTSHAGAEERNSGVLVRARRPSTINQMQAADLGQARLGSHSMDWSMLATRSAPGIGVESTSEVVTVPNDPILSITVSSSSLDLAST